MSGKRRTIARGIYEDRYSRQIRWPGGSKRFPLDAPLEDLVAYRKRQIRHDVDRRRHDGGGSFLRDVARYLRGRRHRPSYKSEKSHLRPWAKLFGRGSRFAITTSAVQRAVDQWHAAGYSPRELRHRVHLLKRLLRALDASGPTPCDAVRLPKIVRRKPRPVSAATIRDVALNLWKAEMKGIGRLRDAKTRARFLILALTGVRPVQVMRAKPTDIDWTRGLWYVDPAKGDEGTVVAFNEQIRAAWQLFAQADAWGPYDCRSFSKTLKRNGWPKDVRPYTLRHTVGQTLRELGADLGAIQDHLGHASPDTTRQFYVGPSIAQQRATSARLDGRVPALALTRFSDTSRPEQKEKEREKPNENTSGRLARKRRKTRPAK